MMKRREFIDAARRCGGGVAAGGAARSSGNAGRSGFSHRSIVRMRSRSVIADFARA